jgi:cysteinyl-tRNA synthetase
MQLRFYNSLTKNIEDFVPREPGKVSLYNCGPTVYKRQHLGNMRRFLFSDTLRRTLEYAGLEVKEITNITDVGHLTQDDADAGEDKLEKAARERKKTPQDIAQEQIALFLQDMRDLNIQPAHFYPRASQHIPQMLDIIKRLLESHHAYHTREAIYFDVQSFPDYGALSGNRLDQLSAGARVEVRSEKKHPADFALWKFDEAHVQQWESPWGRGYPGWHIECSAMSAHYLPLPLDIHTGGEDNRFPHHENEIAQTQAATGKPLANFWMHNAHLQMEGRKLAKREGEQLTLDTVREKSISPLAFRLLVWGAHYRSRMDFSWELMQAAQERLSSFMNLLRRLKPATLPSPASVDSDVLDHFGKALADDLNTPQALAVVYEYLRRANAALDQAQDEPSVRATAWGTLQKMDQVLGIFETLLLALDEESLPEAVRSLVMEREEARAAGDFTQADVLRQKIEAEGFRIEDTPSGSRAVKK